MKELGYPEVELTDWQGVVAPARTPRDIIARLADAVEQAARAPEVQARLRTLGMQSAALGPDDFAAVIAKELKRWPPLVAELGIHAE